VRKRCSRALCIGAAAFIVGVAIFGSAPVASATTCEDGSYSSSVGPGTCSWHGGIKGGDHTYNGPRGSGSGSSGNGFHWTGGWSLMVIAVGGIWAYQAIVNRKPKAKPTPTPSVVTRLPPATSRPGSRTQASGAGTSCSVPGCGGRYIVRNRRSDGKAFLGCSKFPGCRSTKNMYPRSRA
jgi:hypothetical protein